jgi:hypothetical protein
MKQSVFQKMTSIHKPPTHLIQKANQAMATLNRAIKDRQQIDNTLLNSFDMDRYDALKKSDRQKLSAVDDLNRAFTQLRQWKAKHK